MDKQYGLKVDRSSLPNRKQGGTDWINTTGYSVVVSDRVSDFKEILTITDTRREEGKIILSVYNEKYGERDFNALSFKKGKCFSSYFNFTKKHSFLNKGDYLLGAIVIKRYKSNNEMGDSCYDIGCIKCGEALIKIKHSTVHSSNKRCGKCGCVLFSNGVNKVGDSMYSLPERMIKYYLEECGIEYVKEYSPSWANRKRYDFYLEKYNTIIEVHGGFHYNSSGFGDLDTIVSNDLHKRTNALKNGIDAYYEIDCRKSDCLYIKEEIIKTLGEIFPNSNTVNWGYIFAMGKDKKIFEVSKMYMEKKDNILYRCSSKYKISKESVVDKLMIGYGLGLNDYGKDRYENEKSLIKQKEDKPVDIYIPTLGKSGDIEYFKVGSSPNRFILEQFGFPYNSKTVNVGKSSSIKRCCDNNMYSVGGFVVVYKDNNPIEHEKNIRSNCIVKNGNENGFQLAFKKCVSTYLNKLI